MPLTEMTFVSDHYGYTLALLLMPDAEPRYGHGIVKGSLPIFSTDPCPLEEDDIHLRGSCGSNQTHRPDGSRRATRPLGPRS